MAKQRPKKRKYRMINFKLYDDTDTDILDWWEGIEAGDRSEALRDVIREYLGRQPRKTRWLTIPELLEVRQDTLWIRDALNDMPGYLERIMQQVAASHAMQSVRRSNELSEPSSAAPALSDNDSERRTKRMRKATW